MPIGKTALEVFENSGDEAFLEEAYFSIARWDWWLRNYRDTRGTGLVEVFCEWDTGHDNSPRLHGLPQECPGGDANLCAPLSRLPLLAPDLAATAYGNRRALGKIARVLAKENEAARWDEDAETIRAAIFRHCFDKNDLCFYDRDAHGDLIRVRGDVLSRVLCEHVVEGELFEAIYARHIRDPEAFWTPFPLPSIAANDPHFVQPIPPNSWGGASQALTALRAPRWFSHYGKHADLRHLMTQWLDALARSGKFYQQIDPWSGEFTSAPDGYSPAMLCALDFLARLYGVRRDARVLAWSCDAGDSRYQLSWDEQRAAVERNRDGCRLLLDDKEIARVTGTCSLESDETGAPLRVINITAKSQTLTIATSRATFAFVLAPDETRSWNEIETQPQL